ncbi:hypothetical protein ACFW2V_00180 [Streptomyces sp. NPDC058947]|uniref:hypothetical protein n=1 Tax=Streptomyces sp. NPDC058947 TaxID=3346675 RepID=UPI0036B762B0
MLYAGFIHGSAYFGYFHLELFTIGLDPLELVLRSLRLATLPALAVLAVIVMTPRFPELLVTLRVPSPVIDRLVASYRFAGRAHMLFVALGIAAMAAWRYIQPWGWLCPVLIATGLLLGELGPSRPRASSSWGRTVVLTAAALFVVWAIALAATSLGRLDAQRDAERSVLRVEVVVLSTERLSMAPGPAAPRAEDLGAGNHYRYRYSRLRLLVARDQRYYLLPVGWRHERDPTYVIQDDDSIRIELRPGVRRN